jgi:hypothetical protein
MQGMYVPSRLTPIPESAPRGVDSSACGDPSSGSRGLADAVADALLRLGRGGGSSGIGGGDGFPDDLIVTLSDQMDAVTVVLPHYQRADHRGEEDDPTTTTTGTTTGTTTLTFRAEQTSSAHDGGSAGRATFSRPQLRLLYWDVVANSTANRRGIDFCGGLDAGKQEDDGKVTRKRVEDAFAALCRGMPAVAPPLLGASSTDTTALGEVTFLPSNAKVLTSTAPDGNRSRNTARSDGVSSMKATNNNKRTRGLAPLPSGRRKRNNGRLVYGKADNADD